MPHTWADIYSQHGLPVARMQRMHHTCTTMRLIGAALLVVGIYVACHPPSDTTDPNWIVGIHIAGITGLIAGVLCSLFPCATLASDRIFHLNQQHHDIWSHHIFPMESQVLSEFQAYIKSLGVQAKSLPDYETMMALSHSIRTRHPLKPHTQWTEHPPYIQLQAWVHQHQSVCTSQAA